MVNQQIVDHVIGDQNMYGKTKHSWSTINSEHQVDRRSVNRRSNLIWLAMEKLYLRDDLGVEPSAKAYSCRSHLANRNEELCGLATVICFCQTLFVCLPVCVLAR